MKAGCVVIGGLVIASLAITCGLAWAIASLCQMPFWWGLVGAFLLYLVIAAIAMWLLK